MSDELKQVEPATAEDLMLGRIVRDFSGFRFLGFNPDASTVREIHGVDVSPQKYAYIAWGGDPPRLRLVKEFDSEAEFDAWTMSGDA